MKITTEQVKKKIPNPDGKGGFKDNPENRNAGGRPKNLESFKYWLDFFKNLTISEFVEWEKNTLDSEKTVAAGLAYTRIFNARKDLSEFKEVANRTEGMPEIKGQIDSNVIIRIDQELQLDGNTETLHSSSEPEDNTQIEG